MTEATTRSLVVVVGVAVAASALGLGQGTALARKPVDKPRAAAASPAAERARRAVDAKLRQRIGKPPAKLLNLYFGKTKEWLAVEADAKATVEPAVWNEFLRDAFTNHMRPMEPRLVGIVIRAALHFGVDQVLIVSGYRSPKYNLMLRKKGREVARESQHTEGTAVDFKLPGVSAEALRDFLRSLRTGGVGYYPESGFGHADVGKIRTWTGR